MKSKYVILLILIITVFSSPSLGVENKTLVYDRLDLNTNIWSNLTIIDKVFTISSDNEFIDGLSSTFLSSPWYSIENGVKKTDFFNLNETQSEYTISLTISIGVKKNTYRINTKLDYPIAEISEFLDLVDGYHSKITSRNLDSSLWPVDLSIIVLESYPPQFDVSALFIRGNDFLTFVESVTITLVAGEVNNLGNLTDLTWIEQAEHVQNKTLDINSGGQSGTVIFDTFSFGSIDSGNNFSKVGFAIFVGNDLVLQSHLGTEFSIFEPHSSDIDNIPGGKDNTADLLLPFSSIFIISIITISILRKIQITRELIRK